MLRLVVALSAEARPLIEHYRLERDSEARAFKVFRRDDVALVVAGLGKVAAAAATSFLHLAAGGGRNAVWLNVGIAGHGSRAVGEAVLAMLGIKDALAKVKKDRRRKKYKNLCSKPGAAKNPHCKEPLAVLEFCHDSRSGETGTAVRAVPSGEGVSEEIDCE